MEKIIYNTKLKKLLISILLVMMLMTHVSPCLSFATSTTYTLNDYILSVVKSWADDAGNVPWYQYSDRLDTKNIDKIDIEDFWNWSNYTTTNNRGGDPAIFESKSIELIDTIISVLSEDYEKSDGNNTDLNILLYNLISDRQEERKPFLGLGGREGYNNGDLIKITVSNNKITSIDLSALEGTSRSIDTYGIVKIDKSKEENEESEEDELISEGIYKEKNGRYYCTYNVAEPIWNKDGYLEDLVKSYLRDFYSGQSYDFEEVIAKYGNKIDNIKIFFDKIDSNNKPTGNKPTRLDLWMDINDLDLREEVPSTEIEKIREGIYKFKGSGKYFCTYNVGIKAWDEQYIKEKVNSELKVICLDLEFDFDEIIKLYGDDKDKIRIYFDNIDSNNNPVGDKPASDDIKVYITREELLEKNLTKYYDPSDEEDSANAGGILLSPLFFLINFIADATISITGSIMDPEQGWDFGGGVLVGTARNPGYTKTINYEVDIKSFLPDVVNGIGALFGNDSASYKYPNITYTPEEIFAGKIDLLSIDFISGTGKDGNLNENSDWLNIRKVVSQWYQVLRMIAIIGLLSVLIYTGIKIILSANAKDKAKYKEWIMNWFMAVAILFSMHFIMAFIVAVTNEIGGLMTEACQGINVVILEDGVKTGDSFQTNLMGLVRFMIQSENFYIKVGYEVMYIALIWYTLKFTFIYIKRVLSMAFLTLIAPIVALTYPIDKINDGRAQGFDMWLKEYIFNALLQPMHCVLYYVLVGSAVSIAASNPLYGIVVLAFMTEAEKLLKKIFGFDKAGGGTVGGMTNAFAAGAIASSIAKMAKLPKGNGGNGGGGADTKALDNPKPTEKPGMDVFDGSGAGIPDPEPEPNLELPSGGASAAEAFQNSTDPISDSRRELLEEQLADGQISNDDLSDADKALLGIGAASAASAAEAPKPDTEQDIDSSNGDSGKDVRQMAAEKETSRQESKEKSKFAKGAGAVSKKILKPIWDADKSKSYNFKRIGKRIVRAAIGGSLGIGAAAVQAGISITDGKYNPLEGVAAFTAGYAGGGQVAKGIGGLVDTYIEGANAGNTKAQMKRAKDRFGDRDDVIAFNKKNYPGQEQAAMERQRDHYLTAGVTDLKDMKSGMKYADTLVGKTDGLSADEIKAKREKADRMAAATIDFKKTLQDQGQLKAVYDKDKREKYIQSMVDKATDADKAKVRKQYENAFKSVVAYDAANA